MAKDFKSEYAAKLLDPRWQKKRLQILERDEWMCQRCGDKASTLHVHHRYYKFGQDPWDYLDDALVTLCADCHESEGKNAKYEESLLIQTLREKGLWTDDIVSLMIAIGTGVQVHDIGVVMGAFEWALTNEQAQNALVGAYLAECQRRHDAALAKASGGESA